MRLNSTEYIKRLQQYSPDTIRLISEINNGQSREAAIKMSEITTNPELGKAEVKSRLTRLLEQK